MKRKHFKVYILNPRYYQLDKISARGLACWAEKEKTQETRPAHGWEPDNTDKKPSEAGGHVAPAPWWCSLAVV